MASKKKKIFPKVQKKFENFLTDESGKITKKWALGISAWAALIGAFDTVDGATYHYNGSTDTSHSSHASHASHSSWGCDSTHTSNATGSHSNTTYGNFWDMLVEYDPGAGCTVNHASGIVNGHGSANPSGDWASAAVDSITGHGSHVSHSNHGSWGWC